MISSTHFMKLASNIIIVFFFAFPISVFAAPQETGTVIHMYDGDTVMVRIGTHIERVRLLGIDAPERASKGKQKQCYWDEARKALRDSVLKKEIVLTRDEHEHNRDVYGRLLRYISLKENEKNIINEKMVSEGFSYAYNRSSSPIKERYKALEKNAQSQKRGLWSKKTCRGSRYGR